MQAITKKGDNAPPLVRFDIAEVTSEDPNHLATELLDFSTLGDGNGWVSERSPQSPQDLVLKLQPTSETINLSSLTLLAHEFFIPKKIEIIVASNKGGTAVESIEECSSIRNLGCVDLCTNEMSNYEGMERKSISLDSQEAAFVKFRLYGCHQNDLNTFDQVGMAGCELFGSIVEKRQEEDEEAELPIEEKEKGKEEDLKETQEKTEAEANDAAQDEAEEAYEDEFEEDDGGNDGDDAEEDNNDDDDAEKDNTDDDEGHDGAVDDNDVGDEDVDDEDKADGNGDVEIPPTPDRKSEKAPGAVATSGAALPPVASPPPATAQELLEKKARSRVDINRRLARLDRMKRDRAEVEDFECAAKIKNYLDDTNSAFSKLNGLETKMKKASENEDYVEAARIKQERDAARLAVMTSLDNAESVTADMCGLDNLPALAPAERLDEDAKGASNNEEDGALSRTSNTEQADKGEAEAPHKQVARPPSSQKQPQPASSDPPKDQAPSTSRFSTTPADDASIHEKREDRYNDEHQGNDDGSLSAFEDVLDARNVFDEETHPLRGVPGFMDMAAPEDIKDGNGEIPSETIARIESLLGNYLSRCFFSKNFSLREAALAKVSLLLPELSSDSEGVDSNSNSNSNKYYLRTICMMLERAMDDRVIPVFMAALVLLDDCLREFEQSGMSSKDAISHLSMISTLLVRHLGDSKPKVVEGAETALMSLALSDFVGPAYIANQITKRAQDMKAKSAILARMKVAKELMDEFGGGGGQGIRVDVIMDFVSEHGMRNKDAEVREAAKHVAVSASKIIGRNIERYLDGMSDRQRKVIITTAIAAELGGETLHHHRHRQYEEDNDRRAMQMPTSNPPSNHELTEYSQPHHHHQPRGRGRGRRRVE